MAKYSDESFTVEADHDIIYARAYLEKMEPGDRNELISLGWFKNDEDGIAKYV
jgi:hypothetical protein